MKSQDIEQYLSSLDLFNGLSAEAISFLAQNAKSVNVGAEQTVFRNGEPARRFYLVIKGRVTVEIPALYGPTLNIQTLGAGEILGWSWLIPPYQWSFHAKAEEDSEILEFDGENLLARCEKDPAFGYELIKRFAALMSERLDAARRRLMRQWSPPGFA